MTLFEIIIVCIVAALFVATIFVFIVCISYIKQVHITNKQVVTLTNAIFECRSFLEKLSKHDTIIKINNISGLEKKIGELLGICKNQTNNITQVRDNLDKSLEDIKMRNSLIRDNHKFLDNINVKTSIMKQSECLSLRGLDSETRGKKWAKVVGQVTSILPIGNHLVTAIEHDKHTGIYDPTNDIFMHVVGTRKYGFVNDTSATMSYSFISNLIPKMLSQMDTEVSVGYLRKLSTKDRLEYERYKEKKLILKLIDVYKDETNNYEELLAKREEINNILEEIVSIASRRLLESVKQSELIYK